MSAQETNAETFDVFLCHNSEDKPIVREIARKLIEKDLKPWLDEEQIKPGTLWQAALWQQIERIKAAAIFVGESGAAPWQNQEIQAVLNQFLKRQLPVIPAILPSVTTTPPLPWTLANLHWVDFRVPEPDPLKQLVWGITGVRPAQQSPSSNIPPISEHAEDVERLVPPKKKVLIEIKLPGNLDEFSDEDRNKFLRQMHSLLEVGEVHLKRIIPGSIRLHLELKPEDANKIYAATQKGQLSALGISEARLYPAIASPPDEEQRSQLLVLLDRVSETWVDGLLRSSLYNEALISLGKRPLDEAVEPPWKRLIALSSQRSQLLSQDPDITNRFDATGLLLILGEAGSGKTTTLLELAAHLVARAKADVKERFPVVLNLSSWKNQPLTEWMALELSKEYRVSVKLAGSWLQNDYLVPLLDGLDEVPTAMQGGCVAAINDFIDRSQPSGLVVCCRLMEYQWLPERLKLNGAIRLEPLTPEEVSEYLTKGGSKLAALREAVNSDPILQELAQTPLFLSIMSPAGQGPGGNEWASQQGRPVAQRSTPMFGLYAEEMHQRISEAEASEATVLDLSQLYYLTQLPQELQRLSSLQSLDLAGCKQLRDLAPLAGLSSLQSLNLAGCRLVSDLSPLAGLSLLQTLNFFGCGQLGDLSPLAGLTSLQTLDLSGCGRLTDLSPLAGLGALQRLDLSGSGRLTDLSPLAELGALQRLNLFGCGRLTDLSPLAGLGSLQRLNLTGCSALREFGPLRSLLPGLQTISLSGCKFDDLPSALCGEPGENVLSKIRAHYEDLKSGQERDAEVKVLFLGNGGTGKTQLCRRVRGERFDPTLPSTHGIQLSGITIELEGSGSTVRLNLWDFGGQEIYHGSHALFFHGQAVFLFLWLPNFEEGNDSERNMKFCRRPLAYWLDYLRAFAGVDSPVLLIQSQCDTPLQRAPLPKVEVDDLAALQRTQVSAKTDLGLGLLLEHLREAVRDCLYRRPPPSIGAGRVRVRDRLRELLAEDQRRPAAQRQLHLLERKEFDHLCDEVGGISNKEALLGFLHDSGVIFYRTGLLGDCIVLDQNWALEAIYALFDRKKILPLLRGHGRFTRVDLEALIWSDHTPEEQKVFLEMMESCGICFRVRELPPDPHQTQYQAREDKEWEYLAPELLPPWSDAQDQLLGRLREDPPAVAAQARYAFLHEGILRGYLSKIGQHAKNVPVYWKYGCWFYEKITKSQVLIESQWEDSKTEAGPGMIWFRAWGERARELIEPLLGALRSLPVGQPPQITWQGAPAIDSQLFDISQIDGQSKRGLNALVITESSSPSSGSPKVFVSYAWGDDSSEDARQRGEVVDGLCETVRVEGWQVIRDKIALRYGDLISTFMKTLGEADLVIVILSAKYLQSPYCMTELHTLYRNARQEKQAFLDRIIPLVLGDARISTPEERVGHGKYWEARYLKLKSDLDYLSVEDFRLYQDMKDWYNHVGGMLTYANDVLHPQGFEAIVSNDFSALRQILQRVRSERRS